MVRRVSFIVCACLALMPAFLFAQRQGADRLKDAAVVLQEIMQTPDRAIPQELLDSAYAIVIVPGVKKGAFIFGAKYGKGYILCRNPNGMGWSAPGTVIVEGGSFGFQIGASESDVVLLVMNESGVKHLLETQFTLGAGGSIAAGPVGRSAKAETDALLSAEILSWSRTHGIFAGISLQGATLRQDLDGNSDLFGKALTNREITQDKTPVPAPARQLVALLNEYSPRHEQPKPSHTGKH